MVAGAAFLLWGAVAYFWQEPFTGLYAGYQQGRLAREYEERFRIYRPPSGAAEAMAGQVMEGRLARAARAYRTSLPQGKPMGRLTIPRLDLERIVVNGAEGSDLRKGPGRDLRTFMPGEESSSTSPRTARPTARPSATSTASDPATASCSRCPTRASSTESPATPSSPRTT